MGFFSKIWKGVKKTFKKIGRGIKKVFKKVGKFMGKIGIVGQIAMSFILPGIGGVLAKTFGNVVGALSGGALGSIGRAAGWVLGKAGEFAKMAYRGYKTVTGAITDFIGTTGKYVGGKLGIGENLSLSQAFGQEGWAGRLSDSFSKLGNAASEFWDTDIKGVTDPYKGPSMQSIEGKTSVDVDADIQDAINIGDVQGPPKITGALPYGDVESYTYDPITGMAKDIVRESDSLLSPSASPEAAVQEQSTFSKGLEAVTGEETLGGVGRKAASRFGEYLLDAPGKAVASTITTGLGQAAGVIAKPPGDPGPAWGGYASQFAAPTYAATQQAMQPIQPTSFGGFVQNFATGGEQQGSFLGPDFWQSYMQRSLAA